MPGGLMVCMEGWAPENEPDEAKPGTSPALGRLSAAEVTLITGPAALCPPGQSRKTGRERKPDSPQSPGDPWEPASGWKAQRKPVPHIKEPGTHGVQLFGAPRHILSPAAAAQRCLWSVNTTGDTRAPILGTAEAGSPTQDPDSQGLCRHLPVGMEATTTA